MRVAPVGASFLASIVTTGWTGVFFLLTPIFLLLAALVLASSAPSGVREAVQSIYRRLTRFVYVRRRIWSEWRASLTALTRHPWCV